MKKKFIKQHDKIPEVCLGIAKKGSPSHCAPFVAKLSGRRGSLSKQEAGGRKADLYLHPKGGGEAGNQAGSLHKTQTVKGQPEGKRG